MVKSANCWGFSAMGWRMMGESGLKGAFVENRWIFSWQGSDLWGLYGGND